MIKRGITKEKQGLTVLTPGDEFRFECGPQFDCYTRCCRDITIFLTPYDVLRMKNALNMPSGAFLADYAMSMIGDVGLPVVMLKMKDDESKACPFVTQSGCAIYPDRPWSCRIYPLQPESSKLTEKSGKQFYSVMDVPFCLGLKAEKSVKLEEWIDEQGIPAYQEMEAPFKSIIANEFICARQITNKKIQEMFYLACYDLDRFRRFVLESTFLKRFEVEPNVVEKIKTDDVALYFFAMRWLEYGLLGQQAIKVKPDVIKAGRQSLGL